MQNEIEDKFLKHGILELDKLFEIDDLDFIKKVLDSYPLCFGDMLNELYSNNKYKEIYELAIDYNLKYLADSLLLINNPSYGKASLESSIKDTINKIHTNGGELDVNRNRFIKKIDYVIMGQKVYRKTIEEVKEEFLKEVVSQFDKKALTKDLTEEYFNKLLLENSIELLVIKLCVRIEAILQCDYKYEGTFEEMLVQFTNSDNDSNRSKLFHKLRQYRNRIVHPDQREETLNIDELKQLIKYVVSLG